MSSPRKRMAPDVTSVGRIAEKDVGQGRLAGAVGPHQGVHLAAVDRQLDPAQDGLAFDGDVEVLDLEQGRGPFRAHGGITWARPILASLVIFSYGYRRNRPEHPAEECVVPL